MSKEPSQTQSPFGDSDQGSDTQAQDPLDVVREIMEDDLLEPQLRLMAAKTLAEYSHRKLKAAEETDRRKAPEININISSDKDSSGQSKVILDSDRVNPVVH